MTNNNFDTIIFDLGNVLIDFDHHIAVEKICKFTAKTRDEIYQLFFDSGITEVFEEGKIDGPEFYARVKEMLEANLSFDEFLPIWNGIFFITPQNRLMQKLLADLRHAYKLILISNINELHFLYIKDNFDIFSHFHKIILSYEVGKRKPHPLIYQKALEAARTSAQNAVYTDDRLDLIEAAAKLGITSIQFKSLEYLKDNFSKLKIDFEATKI